MKVMKTRMAWLKFWPGRHRGVRVGVVAAAVAACVLGAPPAAMASGADFYKGCRNSDVSCQDGVRVTGTIGPFNRCGTAGSSVGSTEVCIRYDGDVVYVKDGAADGHSAIAQITTAKGVPYRYCRNPYGHGTWAKCDFNWPENAWKEFSGGRILDYNNGHVLYLGGFNNN